MQPVKRLRLFLHPLGYLLFLLLFQVAELLIGLPKLSINPYMIFHVSYHHPFYVHKAFSNNQCHRLLD